MFVEAIEKVDQYTRPIHFILRYYTGSDIVPGTATLFFVNENGFAITCRHVAQQILYASSIYENYLKFKSELRKFEKDPGFDTQRGFLENKYRINGDNPIRILFNFINCVTAYKGLAIHLHPTQDLAIIHFRDFESRQYQDYARFLKDSRLVKQGRYLCRLGYPFPEFTNYQYNKNTGDIEWLSTGRINTPSFPIDGIITRHIGESNGVVGIEMSTPGLRGQSGGPLFDKNGIIYGMQSSTRHLHLGFDQVNREVVTEGHRKKVSNYPFLNVGQCVHVDVIKQFLRDKQVTFYEEEA
ncbi:serine protease [Dyadobacter chenwenxiniae]|uniref:Serine protease n=1 Tax=Dyadobacter chenwenxiniae TaxID=2906456 RepID=A0A9X1PTG7_9BACT|nr:trypsin-like peptidase domain-containing protein [Dyadobacter chenwenxiniae]MCF0051235.1 serine protease [Dyadobacter chenwenxiniae]MCF0065343.1 serine protease [Dyadobacter chenwenxiniae]UON82244.1 serine protease [Dyadobacter chenwenxiniae]